jgi:type VI secretion system protein ImpK
VLGDSRVGEHTGDPMSQDDPFASANSERTLIMPSPGRKTPQTAIVPPETTRFGVPPSAAIVSGVNPLVAAANPLLDLVPQLRASLTHRDPAALRDMFARGVREYERRAGEAGISQEKIIAGRYVLCTLLDETAASTPWGSSGVWGSHSLLVLFHNEAFGGEKFFQLLGRLAENPKANLDLLELMYIALALGLEGRYRLIANGYSQLDALKARLHDMIRRERGEPEHALSANWQPVQVKRNRITAYMPLWVVASLAGVALLGAYMTFRFNINSRSDPVYAHIESIRIKTSPPPLAPAPAPATQPRLATLLAPEIQRGLLEVRDEPTRSLVVIRGDNLFAPGSAEVSSSVLPLVERIGDALKSVPGNVMVTGHTDSQPIRTLRFPSNWHLSRERAQNVADLLKTRIPGRVSAEGKADTEPVTQNDTAINRAQNRRVEITLQLAGGSA